MKFGLLFFLYGAVMSVAFASPGEVKQIDHNNIVSFSSADAECQYYYDYISGDDSTSYFSADVATWVYLKYKDGDKTRTLGFPLQWRNDGYSDTPKPTACSNAFDVVHERAAKWNLDFNDIQMNNLSAAEGTCTAKYVVATLGKEITLSDGSKVDTAHLEVGRKAVACP
jgi:hypothetical protein